jgi:hypothetical protein
MDNVQKHNICTNVPSPQTFRSYLKGLVQNKIKDHNLTDRIKSKFVLKPEVQKYCVPVRNNPTRHGNKTMRTHLYVSPAAVRAHGRVLIDRDVHFLRILDSQSSSDILTRNLYSSN